MKDIEGCWQCDDFPMCEKLKMLKLGHGVAHLKNLRKLKSQGLTDFVKGKRYWYAAKQGCREMKRPFLYKGLIVLLSKKARSMT